MNIFADYATSPQAKRYVVYFFNQFTRDSQLNTFAHNIISEALHDNNLPMIPQFS